MDIWLKILNMVIPIPMHFCRSYELEYCKPRKAACHPMKCDIINDSLSQIFNVIQSDKIVTKSSALEYDLIRRFICFIFNASPSL